MGLENLFKALLDPGGLKARDVVELQGAGDSVAQTPITAHAVPQSIEVGCGASAASRLVPWTSHEPSAS